MGQTGVPVAELCRQHGISEQTYSRRQAAAEGPTRFVICGVQAAGYAPGGR